MKGFRFCLFVYFSIEANYLIVGANNKDIEAVLTQKTKTLLTVVLKASFGTS